MAPDAAGAFISQSQHPLETTAPPHLSVIPMKGRDGALAQAGGPQKPEAGQARESWRGTRGGSACHHPGTRRGHPGAQVYGRGGRHTAHRQSGVCCPWTVMGGLPTGRPLAQQACFRKGHLAPSQGVARGGHQRGWGLGHAEGHWVSTQGAPGPRNSFIQSFIHSPSEDLLARLGGHALMIRPLLAPHAARLELHHRPPRDQVSP